MKPVVVIVGRPGQSVFAPLLVRSTPILGIMTEDVAADIKSHTRIPDISCFAEKIACEHPKDHLRKKREEGLKPRLKWKRPENDKRKR